MIEINKNIKIMSSGHVVPLYAKYYEVGYVFYDDYGKQWEIGEDINFDKFWFREVK